MSVLVLMSTYNGEKYLKTQLDSILNQDYLDLEILIRDDGSVDATHEIIKDYVKKYANISWYTGKNIGVQKSFFDLIEKADLGKDYYAFADQDDKWLPGKISRAVSILERYSKETPVLYCSDTIIVNDRLEPLKVTVSRIMKQVSFGNALVQDMCTGCTATMNNLLLNMIRHKIPDYVIMHDWWFYLTATCFGEVFYDKESYILYRQHDNNTSGAMVNNRKLLQYRFKQLWSKRGQIYQQAESFQKVFDENNIPEPNQKLLTLLLKSKQKQKYRFVVAANSLIYRQKFVDNIVLKVIVIIGKL